VVVVVAVLPLLLLEVVVELQLVQLAEVLQVASALLGEMPLLVVVLLVLLLDQAPWQYRKHNRKKVFLLFLAVVAVELLVPEAVELLEEVPGTTETENLLVFVRLSTKCNYHEHT